MKEIYKSRLILVTLIGMLMFYLFNSNLVIVSILDYTEIFMKKLFPVSFIFFIISSLLIDYGIIYFLDRVFHVRTTNLYIFLISMISGFPSGSKYTKDLYNNGIVGVNEANRMLMFSHFPNPIFMISSLTLVIDDNKIIICLLLAIILSNLIILIFSRKTQEYKSTYTINDDFSKGLVKAIHNSLKVLITIYGVSIFFYLIACIIINTFDINGILYVIICGAFDLTKGIYSSILISNVYLRGLVVLLFISFGGVSIHLQVKSILSDTSIKYKYFFIGRVIGTFLAIVIFNILYFI